MAGSLVGGCGGSLAEQQVADGGAMPDSMTADAPTYATADAKAEHVDVGSVITLASGQNSPWAIAVDERNVYWTTGGTANGDGTVMKVSKDGGSVTTIASAQPNPWGLAVDATRVYWTNHVPSSGTVMMAPK